MLIEEQEEVIAMLERLRAKKRYVRLSLWSFAGEARGAEEGGGKEREKGNGNSSSPSGLIVFLFFFFFFFLQITVTRLFGKGDRYQGRGI